MGKRLIVVLALALLVGVTFSAAYAEVQNVKVSGDITTLNIISIDKIFISIIIGSSSK